MHSQTNRYKSYNYKCAPTHITQILTFVPPPTNKMQSNCSAIFEQPQSWCRGCCWWWVWQNGSHWQRCWGRNGEDVATIWMSREKMTEARGVVDSMNKDVWDWTWMMRVFWTFCSKFNMVSNDHIWKELKIMYLKIKKRFEYNKS